MNLVAVFTLAALFSLKSIDAVNASFLPIYEVTKQAVGHDGLVLFLLIWLDFTFISTVPGAMLTTGRLVWAFSRDGGLPYSPVFDKISDKYQVPVAAILISFVFCLLFGLIYIGSTVAFNTFISSTIIFAFLSYALPQLFLLATGHTPGGLRLMERWSKVRFVPSMHSGSFIVWIRSKTAVGVPTYRPTHIGAITLGNTR
ncbi:hypothetical protein BP6252_13065 [Coleophoma cylindrospora]|uniref:Amino acid permease/ SLC12A domain-containing protein n=1 Tax=Coleophoma cylindrospora TaxID=1849047 RepID=A0A3D8Q9W4_9HELO|nr:hypothetical protein BP6252_13065 [Coleophoma cylindrospora]